MDEEQMNTTIDTTKRYINDVLLPIVHACLLVISRIFTDEYHTINLE